MAERRKTDPEGKAIALIAIAVEKLGDSVESALADLSPDARSRVLTLVAGRWPTLPLPKTEEKEGATP